LSTIYNKNKTVDNRQRAPYIRSTLGALMSVVRGPHARATVAVYLPTVADIARYY